MLFTYNKQYVGDVLMVVVADNHGQGVSVERQGKVARVFRTDTEQTVAWNIFEASSIAPLEGSGQIALTKEALAAFNAELETSGFAERLVLDTMPKFVVGEIVEIKEHPDSDHLHICQVQIAADKTVQIVCGAPNARLGLKSVVALPGAMMPSGSLIFPGQLRGEDSFGMMCSPRELALPNAPEKRGIIELAATAEVGQAFDAEKHWQ